jgi:hypothetical protein
VSIDVSPGVPRRNVLRDNRHALSEFPRARYVSTDSTFSDRLPNIQGRPRGHPHGVVA